MPGGGVIVATGFGGSGQGVQMGMLVLVLLQNGMGSGGGISVMTGTGNGGKARATSVGSWKSSSWGLRVGNRVAGTTGDTACCGGAATGRFRRLCASCI